MLCSIYRHVSACTIRRTRRAGMRFVSCFFFPSDSKYKRVYNLMILYLLFSLQKYVREYFALLFCFWFSFLFLLLFLFLNKTAIELKIKYDARQFLQRERQRERLSGRDGRKDGGQRVVVVVIQCCLPVQKSERAPSAHCSQ